MRSQVERRMPAASQGGSQQPRNAPLTQPSQRDDSQALSDEETNKLVSDVMRLMLFKHHQQPGVPVTRYELTQLITKNYKQRYLPNTVISMAQKKMLATFGFEMKEFQRMRSSKAAKAAGTAQGDAKEYVLTTTVPEPFLKKYVETPDSAAVHSLTLLVVGIIKIAGGEKVSEETLWQNLRKLGIEEQDVQHPVFGNIKNSIERMARQRYIQKEKLSGSDGDGFVYELAERALDESFRTRLDECLTKIITQYNTTTTFRSPS